MIRYALVCSNSHRFESWFSSSADYDRLRDAGLVSCAICGSTEVKKEIMAPGVALSESPREKTKANLSAPTTPLEAAMIEFRKAVEANSENVGRNFASEARKIHDGDAPQRPIIGEARPAEAKSLIEDGVKIMPLPWSGNKTN